MELTRHIEETREFKQSSVKCVSGFHNVQKIKCEFNAKHRLPFLDLKRIKRIRRNVGIVSGSSPMIFHRHHVEFGILRSPVSVRQFFSKRTLLQRERERERERER